MAGKMIIVIHLILTMVAHSYQVNQMDEVDTTSQHNIAFDLPDIIVKSQTSFGEVQLEAYKAITNDQILRNEKNHENRVDQLFWVSIGNPTLLSTAHKLNASIQRIFHSTPNGFYATIQMLTPGQSDLLAFAASKKYNTTINSSQIVHLVMSKFECTIDLFDKDQRYIAKGKVRDFRNYPLRLDFTLPQGTREHALLKTQLENELDVDLDCIIASGGKQSRVNTLTITAEQSKQLGINDKLFGPTNAGDKMVFVTQEQLIQLSAAMYSTLNIVEEYQIPQFQFSPIFVDELILQAGVSTFKPVPLSECINELSKYGLHSNQILKLNEIIKDLGEIFELQLNNNERYIVVNDKHLDLLKESGKLNVDRSGKVVYLGMFNIGGSINHSKEHVKEWIVGGMDLKEQMRKLNSEANDDLEWKIENNHIIPAIIKAAKLSRPKFDKAITFKRVVRHFTDEPFNVGFALYSHKFGTLVNYHDILMSEIKSQTVQLSSLSEKTVNFIDSSNARMDTLNAQLSASTKNVNSQLSSLSQEIVNFTRSSDARVDKLDLQLSASINNVASQLSLLSEKSVNFMDTSNSRMDTLDMQLSASINNVASQLSSLSERSVNFMDTSNSHMSTLDVQLSTSINSVNTLFQTVRSNKEETDRISNSLQSQITKSQQTLQVINQWVGGNYCILANGHCPSGFTRYEAYLKALGLWSGRDDQNHNRYIKQAHFGSSSVLCHGNCFDPWAGEINLAVCCK